YVSTCGGASPGGNRAVGRGAGLEPADARRLENRSVFSVLTNVFSVRQARFRYRSDAAAPAASAGAVADGRVVARGARSVRAVGSSCGVRATRSRAARYVLLRVAFRDRGTAGRIADPCARAGALRARGERQPLHRVSRFRAPAGLGRVLSRAPAGTTLPRGHRPDATARPIQSDPGGFAPAGPPRRRSRGPLAPLRSGGRACGAPSPLCGS